MSRPIALPIGLNPMGAAMNMALDQFGVANTPPDAPSAPPPARLMMEIAERVKDSFTDPYMVGRGDNLTKIARKHKTSVQALMAMNPQIKNPNLIFPGQEIKVPRSVSEERARQYETNPYLQEAETAPPTPNMRSMDPRMMGLTPEERARNDAIQPSMGPVEALMGGVGALNALRQAPQALLQMLGRMPPMQPAGRVVYPLTRPDGTPSFQNVMPYGGNMGAARAAAYQPMQRMREQQALSDHLARTMEGSSLQLNPLRLMQQLMRSQ